MSVAEPDNNSEEVKMQNFPTEGGEMVCSDILVAFFSYNFSQIFENGEVFTPSYHPLAPPLLYLLTWSSIPVRPSFKECNEKAQFSCSYHFQHSDTLFSLTTLQNNWMNYRSQGPTQMPSKELFLQAIPQMLFMSVTNVDSIMNTKILFRIF